MVTKISATYEQRIIRDEYFHTQSSTDGRWPHIERVMDSRLGRFTLQHLQNFCWTIERTLAARRRKRDRRMAGVAAPRTSSASEGPLRRRRLLLDMTNTYRKGAQGGISRVCLMFAKQCAETGDAYAVVLEQGRLYRLVGTTIGEPIEICAGDVYVVIDCFWSPFDEYIAFIEEHRPDGLVVATCFYDIIIALYPFVLPGHTFDAFVEALPRMIEASDICLSISKSSLDDLTLYAARAVPNAQPLYRAFAPGCDIARDAGARDALLAERYREAPLFLSVGTIEPKKGYMLSLDAMDLLWDGGSDCNFLIIGKDGWCSAAVVERIKSHPRFGTNLFWEASADDAFLDRAYRSCHCFVQASVGEGFGLPVVEAASYRLPVICSDIDVFKEIGGDGLTYFESGNAVSLAQRLRLSLQSSPPVATIETISWRAAFLALRDTLETCAALRADREDRGMAA